MREWIFYLMITLVSFLGVTLPLVAYPSWNPPKNPLRIKVYSLEKKVKKLEAILASMKKKPVILSESLHLTLLQKKKISKILPQFSSDSNSLSIWEELEIREKILEILTPDQQNQYLTALKKSSQSF